MRRRTQGACIVKGCEDKRNPGRIPDTFTSDKNNTSAGALNPLNNFRACEKESPEKEGRATREEAEKEIPFLTYVVNALIGKEEVVNESGTFDDIKKVFLKTIKKRKDGIRLEHLRSV